MTQDTTVARAQVIAGIKANPALGTPDPALMAELEAPGGDCSFEALGFDSLASMELCIFIECETRVALSAGDLERFPSVNRLAAYLAAQLGDATA